MLLAPGQPWVHAASEREAKAAELQRLRARIEELRQSLDSVRTRHDQARAELATLERRIGTLVRDITRVEDELRASRARLAELKRREARHAEELGAQRSLLARQARAAYATGRQEYLKLLLNQEDPAALGRVLTYYGYFNRARAERIAAVRATLQELAAVRGDIAAEAEALAELQQRQRRDRAALEGTHRERSRLVARLNEEIRSKGEELSRMLENERRLQELVEALHEMLADVPPGSGDRRPFGELKGALRWPVAGRVQALFGRDREAGRLKWNGVLIDSRQGETVRAVSHGRVAFADWLRGYGLLLIIDHGDGYMTLYGHNESLFKETGDWVEPGEPVARVGASGGRAQAGLYFELRHEGRPIDPGQWFRG